jgi:hypothetical protein
MRGASKILVRNLERKRPLRRLEGKILEGVDWINLAQY